MILGLIADDFTGASDVASSLAEAGVSTSLYNGIPTEVDVCCQAAVIALKTRTCPVELAVSQTLAALKTLQEGGAERFYLKYCSTFDSTPKGNIGPAVDAVMKALHTAVTVLDPALPVNGRILKNGILYVNGVPLAESPMQYHPLTPMWDSSIEKLMQDQGEGQTIVVPLMVLEDEKAVAGLLQQKPQATKSVYFVPDHWREEHADLIIRRFGKLPLLTGGSALAGAWGRCYAKGCKLPPAATNGSGILLAGSCSEATRSQIDFWRAQGFCTVHLDPWHLAENQQAEETRVLQFLQRGDCLIYTSGTPNEVHKLQEKYPQIYQTIEEAFAHLAVAAVNFGIKRLIVAGGETSGAVVQALGYSDFTLSASVSPGVPVLIPREAPSIRLVLKSGNFGDKDFFVKAWERTNAI